MGLFGFLKEEKNDVRQRRPVNSNASNIDDLNERIPVLICAGDYSNDGIFYVEGNTLCMHVLIDY